MPAGLAVKLQPIDDLVDHLALGAHGYAVRPHISNSLNAATRECYKFGGKECVIRAWACDAKG